MTITLDRIPVRQIKGVSARKEEELHAFGIRTAEDLLEYFPPGEAVDDDAVDRADRPG